MEKKTVERRECLWKWFAVNPTTRKAEMPRLCQTRGCSGIFFGGELPKCEEFISIEDAILRSTRDRK